MRSPAPKINFKNSSFNLAYSLRYDSTDSKVDPNSLPFMTQNLSLVTINNYDAKNKTRKEILTKNCEIKDFLYEFNNISYSNLKLSEFTCAKVNESVEIEGTFTNPKYRYVELAMLIKDDFPSRNLSNISEFFQKNPVKLVVYWL